MYVTLISTQASTYFIPIILRYVKKKKREANEKNKTKQTIYSFIFSLRCTASLAAPNEKSGMIHLKTKKKKDIHLPSWYSYWG